MISSRRCLIGLTLAALAGCAPNASDVFEPDWDRIIVQRGTLDDVDPNDLPAPAIAEPPPFVDLLAPGPHPISVEQAVLLALGQNRDLAVAQFNPVITGAFENIERGLFDPEVFANASFLREESVETARSTGGQFSVRGEDVVLDAGVRQLLPTGTDVEVGVAQTRASSNRAPEQQSLRGGITITQALLRGFGPAVNLASVRQAELETSISRSELRGFVETLLAETEVAYWRYLLAGRTITIFERSLEVARQQSDQVSQRIEVGVLPRTEAAAARSEVALREQALIDARSQLEAARLQLLRQMGAPMVHPAPMLEPISEPATEVEPLEDAPARLAIARRLRPELTEARLRLDQNRLETVRTRNGLLPRLDFFIALGKSGYADTFSGSVRDVDGGNYDVTIGASISQYLGRTAARGLHEAAVATRQQSAAAVANLEQLVDLDVQLALNDARRARDQIAATAVTRQLQEETARAEQERFDVGASTALLVAQAQRDLLAAQIAEVEAVTNYRIALVRLYQAEGSLLERRGIALAP